MHLSPPVVLAAVRSMAVVLLLIRCGLLLIIVGFCNCSLFCCALHCVHSCYAIISMGKRELVALLCLSSWGLVIVVWLFLTMPWVCLQFLIVVFPDHTHLITVFENQFSVFLRVAVLHKFYCTLFNMFI